MTSRYRTHLVIKLFPSVPKGLFGRGRIGQRLTDLLERHVFYREFTLSPPRAAFLLAAAVALMAWSVVSLGVVVHAMLVADGFRAEVEAREADLSGQAERLQAARRDYHLLLSRLTPLNERVDRISAFSRKLAVVAGIESLATELSTSASDRRLDLRLSAEEIAELDRRFERLGSFIETREVELARTPSISPLLATSFVPTDRFGYRTSRLSREPSRQAHGGGGRQFHAGLDLAAPAGTPILATADGRVHFAGSIPPRQDAGASLYGNFVVLDHQNGMRSVYAHCREVAVETGQSVRRGDVIGWVGSTGRSTGPHLHYEVVVHGRPMDPELFVLDVAMPDRRVEVQVEDGSLLMDEVDELLAR